MSRNTVLIPPFLTEAFVTDRGTVAEALLSIFQKNIHDNGTENNPEETDADEDSQSKEDNEK